MYQFPIGPKGDKKENSGVEGRWRRLVYWRRGLRKGTGTVGMFGRGQGRMEDGEQLPAADHGPEWGEGLIQCRHPHG